MRKIYQFTDSYFNKNKNTPSTKYLNLECEIIKISEQVKNDLTIDELTIDNKISKLSTLTNISQND